MHPQFKTIIEVKFLSNNCLSSYVLFTSSLQVNLCHLITCQCGIVCLHNLHIAALLLPVSKNLQIPNVSLVKISSQKFMICRYNGGTVLITICHHFFLSSLLTIYIIIRDCTRVGAFPRAFCVPNSVALASLTLQVVYWAIH